MSTRTAAQLRRAALNSYFGIWSLESSKRHFTRTPSLQLRSFKTKIQTPQHDAQTCPAATHIYSDDAISIANGDVTCAIDAEWEAAFSALSDTNKLPMSPFMDPEYIEAKAKHHVAKPRPSSDLTEFQKRLAKNPYAQMLATPPRQCHITKVLLPSYFLQGFGQMVHPVFNEPWQVPKNLTKKHEMTSDGSKRATLPARTIENTTSRPATRALSSSTIPVSSPGRTPSDDTENVENPLADTDTSNAPSSRTTAPASKIGPSTYYLARHELISSIYDPKNGMRPDWKRLLLPPRREAHAMTRKIAHATQARSDMATFVLELLRRRLLENLEHKSKLERGYVSGSANWEDATLSKRQAGAILWTGSYRDSDFGDEFSEQISVPEFATLEKAAATKKKIAVYDLRRLLGAEHLATLRRACPVYQKEIVSIRDKRVTLDLRMKLWKLEGWLATYGVDKIEKPSSPATGSCQHNDNLLISSSEISNRISDESEDSSMTLYRPMFPG
ncbi:hypothetical protein B0O99DRAFT_142257 [Bisporella sp. PMI_857]|nr:hypothetical protein B0O99DRAFT_142257 [Bisporella sp. PMI_857]